METQPASAQQMMTVCRFQEIRIMDIPKRTFEELYTYVLHKVWEDAFSKEDLIGYIVSLKVTHVEEMEALKNGREGGKDENS